MATINPNEVERVDKEVRKLTGGGADVAFEVIGNPTTMQAAFSTLRKGGRLVVVGYTNKPVELSAAKIMYFEMEVIGSLGCRPVDYPRIIEMARMGKIKVEQLVTGRYPLEKINDAFDVMRQGVPDALRSIVTP